VHGGGIHCAASDFQVPIENAVDVDAVGSVIIVRGYVVVERVVASRCVVQMKAGGAETFSCGAFMAGSQGDPSRKRSQ